MRFRFILIAMLSVFGAGTTFADEATIVLVTDFTNTGKEIKDGADQAVRDLQAAGGLLGMDVTLQLEDDGATAEIAAAVAQKVVRAPPMVVIGNTYSYKVLASAPIYAAAGILQITPNTISPLITEQGYRTLFRTTGRADKEGEVAGNFLADHWKDQRIAILEGDTNVAIATKSGIDAMLAALHQKGVHETLIATFKAGAPDYAPLIETLKKAGIKVVYLNAFADNSGTIIRQMRRLGFKATIFGGTTTGTSAFKDFAGPDADGVLFTTLPDPGRDPANSALAARIRAAGGEPSSFVFLTYAAIQIWAEAVRRTGSFDPAKVAETLHRDSFDSVLGRVSFDAKGDITGPGAAWTVYVWHGAKYEPWHP